MPELEEWREMVRQLAQPFGTMDFLPRSPNNGQALGLPYIDARDVQTRLDVVCGGQWSFDFELLSPDGKMVKGKLTVCGVTRCDAGEADQEGEPLKSAVSDALKRCAVHFGIGRYLYHLPKVWGKYDQSKRRFTEPPAFEPRVISKAVSLAIGHTLGHPAPPRTAPETQPESTGDRKAAAEPKPAEPARNGGAVESAQRVADRPQPGFIGGKPAAPAQDGALTCARPECGRSLTRGQHEMSVRNYGAGYCPPCQKLQARSAEGIPEGAKGPLEIARDGYFATLGERFGKLEDPLRYAVEAVVQGLPQPLAPGAKDGWTVEDWRKYRGFIQNCDPQQVLDAARAMVGKQMTAAGQTAFGRL